MAVQTQRNPGIIGAEVVLYDSTTSVGTVVEVFPRGDITIRSPHGDLILPPCKFFRLPDGTVELLFDKREFDIRLQGE